MSIEHIALKAQVGVLWALLLLTVIVAVFLAMRLVQTREQMRKIRGRELQAVRTESERAAEVGVLRAQLIDAEARVALAQKEMRRAVAIRLKTERRLTAQNAELAEAAEIRKDRDWLKRFVDHVDT
jgi:hypothetical protein